MTMLINAGLLVRRDIRHYLMRNDIDYVEDKGVLGSTFALRGGDSAIAALRYIDRITGKGFPESGDVWVAGVSKGSSDYEVRVIKMGDWFNGYMSLPDGHPWLNIKDEADIPWDVHGGCTYRKGNVIGFDTAGTDIRSTDVKNQLMDTVDDAMMAMG